MTLSPEINISRNTFISDSLKESSDTKLRILQQCVPDISKAVDIILQAFNSKKKVLLCGNGGSAADAQHLATEFVIRNRPHH